MSKCLTVVALVLLVLTGAMGLRNISAANAATFSAANLSAPAFWATAIGPAPPIPPKGGGNVVATAIGPAPPIPPKGGGNVVATAIGPAPPIPPNGGGNVVATAIGPAPPIPPKGGGN
jgi:hypothetical protein